MNVRTLQPEDRTSWQVLWRGYLDFYRVDLAEDIIDDVWERLMAPDNALHGFVAEHDGKLVGLVHYFFHGTTWHKTSYCYLEDLYVDLNLRKLGAGRALIEAVKQAALQEGAVKLYWHTDAGNETARGLYDQLCEVTDFVRYDISLTTDT